MYSLECEWNASIRRSDDLIFRIFCKSNLIFAKKNLRKVIYIFESISGALSISIASNGCWRRCVRHENYQHSLDINWHFIPITLTKLLMKHAEMMRHRFPKFTIEENDDERPGHDDKCCWEISWCHMIIRLCDKRWKNNESVSNQLSTEYTQLVDEETPATWSLSRAPSTQRGQQFWMCRSRWSHWPA